MRKKWFCQQFKWTLFFYVKKWYSLSLCLALKKFFYLVQLEDDYFTISWWFFPYINMNQPQVYMCCLPRALPPPTHPIRLGCPEHWLWMPCFMHQACTGRLIYFMVKYYLFMIMMRKTRDYMAISWDGLAILSVCFSWTNCQWTDIMMTLIQKSKEWFCHRIDSCRLSYVNYWQNPGFS